MATSDKGLVGIPLRAKLSAKYKNSFAYPTIKDRCPVILCKVNSLFLIFVTETISRTDEGQPITITEF